MYLNTFEINKNMVKEKMMSLKKIVSVMALVVVAAMMIVPVSAAVTQTIVATQSGTGNVQILGNYNTGTAGSQTIVAIQDGGTPTAKSGGNYQYLVNYNVGSTKPVQNIFNYQTGTGNYVYKKNIWVVK